MFALMRRMINIHNLLILSGISIQQKKEGEYRFDIWSGEKHTHALFYCSASVDILLTRRSQFLATKQQYKKEGSALDGAYLIYDSEEDALYYSHKADHNGGRERMGMAVLIARYLQLDDDPLLEESLKNIWIIFIVNYMTEIQAQYIMTCKE